jgi:hypothetical protein
MLLHKGNSKNHSEAGVDHHRTEELAPASSGALGNSIGATSNRDRRDPNNDKTHDTPRVRG